MLRSVLKGTGLLIGAYLALSWATNAGTLLTNGGKAGTGVIKALQGR